MAGKTYAEKAAAIVDDAHGALGTCEALDERTGRPAAAIRALETVARKASNLATRIRRDREGGAFAK